ncbi:MAG TPA: hypothetical protein PKH07_07280 [bacterium]|nr:hypothetical protein [bacterium]
MRIAYRIVLLGLVVGLAGCASAPRVTEVSSMPDPEVNRLDGTWGSEDVHLVVEKMVSSMISDEPIASRTDVPLVFFLGVKNMTSDHEIQPVEIEDAISVAAHKSRKVKFSAVKDISDEMVDQLGFQKSALTDPETARQYGKMKGWQYTLYGQVTSIVKRDPKIREKRYRMTLKLADIETGVIEWLDEKEIRLREKRSSVGW